MLILLFLFLQLKPLASGFSFDTAHQVIYLNVQFSLLILLGILITFGAEGIHLLKFSSPYFQNNKLSWVHILMTFFSLSPLHVFLFAKHPYVGVPRDQTLARFTLLKNM